jgi:hypothetical protein
LGYILGDFPKNSSGHPGDMNRDEKSYLAKNGHIHHDLETSAYYKLKEKKEI